MIFYSTGTSGLTILHMDNGEKYELPKQILQLQKLMLFLTTRNIVMKATLMAYAEANYLTYLTVLSLPNNKLFQA